MSAPVTEAVERTIDHLADARVGIFDAMRDVGPVSPRLEGDLKTLFNQVDEALQRLTTIRSALDGAGL